MDATVLNNGKSSTVEEVIHKQIVSHDPPKTNVYSDRTTSNILQSQNMNICNEASEDQERSLENVNRLGLMNNPQDYIIQSATRQQIFDIPDRTHRPQEKMVVVEHTIFTLLDE